MSLKGLSVFIGMPVNRDVPPETAASLVETCMALHDRGVHYECKMQVGSSIIESARSRVAHEFLKSDKNRLFWIDSDVVWKPADFLRLLAFSQKMQCVGGCYPSRTDPPTFTLKPVGSLDVQANEWGCLPIAGMGLGFTIVQRHVMEQMANVSPVLRFPDCAEPIAHMFRCDEEGDLFRGEDMAFFADLRGLGHEVWVDPSIELGHVGAKVYRGRLMDALKEAPC